MDIEARDALIAAIRVEPPKAASAGLAFLRLAKDLEHAQKPVQLSYADVAALENSLNNPMSEVNNLVRMDFYGDIHRAFSHALDAGVFTTGVDTVRARIA